MLREKKRQSFFLLIIKIVVNPLIEKIISDNQMSNAGGCKICLYFLDGKILSKRTQQKLLKFKSHWSIAVIASVA